MRLTISLEAGISSRDITDQSNAHRHKIAISQPQRENTGQLNSFDAIEEALLLCLNMTEVTKHRQQQHNIRENLQLLLGVGKIYISQTLFKLLPLCPSLSS